MMVSASLNLFKSSVQQQRRRMFCTTTATGFQSFRKSDEAWRTVMDAKSQELADRTGNFIDSFSNLSNERGQEGAKVGSITAYWPSGVTFCMPQCDNKQELAPIELHIRRRTVKGERRDLCAVFDFAGIRDKFPLCADGKFPFEADLPHDDCGESQPEQLVFV